MPMPLEAPSKTIQGKSILSQLLAATKNFRLYPSDHPTVTESVTELVSSLRALSQECATFTIFEGEFYFEDELLLLESPSFREFCRSLLESGIQSVSFGREVTAPEIMIFIELSCQDPSCFTEESFFEKLKKRGVRSIWGGVITALPVDSPPSTGSEKASPKELYASAVDAIKEAMNACKSGTPIKVRQIRNVVSSLIDMARADEPALLVLTAIKNYDEYTYYHSVNVCILSLAIGMRLGLSEKSLSLLGCSALLHDVGKILIPKEILNKPRSLNQEEKEILIKHATDGARILASLPHPYKYSAIVALEHHRRYNAERDLSCEDDQKTHIYSRIVQAADVYDASASRRSYKKAWLPVQSIRYLLMKSGTLFDPHVTQILTEIVGLYPIGSLVEMNTKELALVISLNAEDMTRPKVKIIKDEANQDIDPFEVELVNDQERSIVNFLSPQERQIDIRKYI